MALISKSAGGWTTSADELAAAIVSVTLPAPPPGYCNVVKRIFGYMRGGTSTQLRLNWQSSPVAGSPDTVTMNRNLQELTRTAGLAQSVDLNAGEAVIAGGNGQQTDIGLSGNVADSTQCGLWVIWQVRGSR